MATKRDESQQTDRKTTLTPRQRKIIPLLVTCSTITEAAKKAKVNRATVHEWMKDGDFRAEVGRQRDAVTQEAFGMLASNLTRAVEVLAGLLNDGDKRLKRFAANDILNHFARHKELNELTERIEAIEQALAKRT
jgi:phage terminase small subunit